HFDGGGGCERISFTVNGFSRQSRSMEKNTFFPFLKHVSIYDTLYFLHHRQIVKGLYPARF
ncbi:MAG: hypothetical protein LBT14_08195, partial [Treponema sp.]|nr:hypothetical protein [Treponema sp.]